MTIKLLSPVPFSRILAIADAPSILSALNSPLPTANLLALAILDKAARTAADAAILSTIPDLFEALVTRWLEAADVGVGERAGKVLGDLLSRDCDVVNSQVPGAGAGAVNGTEIVQRHEPGHGRLWHMLFGSEQFFSIVPDLCSKNDNDDDAETARTERQISFSQGRLLRLLPRLATLNVQALTRTAFPDHVPMPQNLARLTGQGLLPWAALVMVDKGDLLMYMNLVSFFEELVSNMRISGQGQAALDAMRALVKAATANDEQLKATLLSLPDRTIEDEAEPLRAYINQLLS